MELHRITVPLLNRTVVEACPDKVNPEPHVTKSPWLFSFELSGRAKFPSKTGAGFKNNTPPTQACEPSSCEKLSNFHQLRHPLNCRNEGVKDQVINDLDPVGEIIVGL